MFFQRLLSRSRKGSCKKPDRRARLGVEVLEDRLTPAEYTWSGVADGLWSTPTNWTQNGVPGPNDTAIFKATDNDNSVMDLQTDIGVLKIEGYTGTIKLQRILTVYVLTMSSGTITKHDTWLDGGALHHFAIRQDIATIFGASSWTGGNIGGGSSGFVFKNIGSATHPLTFNVGSAMSTPTFAGAQWSISGQNRTDVVVNWDNGNINMAPLAAQGITNNILNRGTFVARSTGKISTNNQANKWVFTNRGDVVLRGDKQFEYCIFETKQGSATYKRAALDGTPGTFTVVGDFVHEDGIVQIESGTLAVTTIAAGDGGDYTVSGGTLTASGPQSAIVLSGDYRQTGGTATLSLTAITVGYDFVVSGGSFNYRGTGTANTLTANTVSIERSSPTAFGTFSVLGGVFVRANTFTNAGLVDLESTSEYPSTGVLIVYDCYGGNSAAFTQTANGAANLRLTHGGQMSIIDIHGTGAFAGTAHVFLTSGYWPPMYQEFWLINADTLSGSVAWDFSGAPLPYGHWVTGLNTSDGRHHWYIKWVM